MSKNYPELTLLSKSEAAKALTIGKDKLNQLLENGQINVLEIGGSIKIPYLSLLDFIKTNSKKINNSLNVENFGEKNEIPEELLGEFDSADIFNKLIEGEISNG